MFVELRGFLLWFWWVSEDGWSCTHDSTLRSYKKSAIRIYVPISLLYDLENLVRKTKAPGSVNGCANKSLKRMSHRLCMMSPTINIHSYPLNITNWSGSKNGCIIIFTAQYQIQCDDAHLGIATTSSRESNIGRHPSISWRQIRPGSVDTNRAGHLYKLRKENLQLPILWPFSTSPNSPGDFQNARESPMEKWSSDTRFCFAKLRGTKR